MHSLIHPPPPQNTSLSQRVNKLEKRYRLGWNEKEYRRGVPLYTAQGFKLAEEAAGNSENRVNVPAAFSKRTVEDEVGAEEFPDDNADDSREYIR